MADPELIALLEASIALVEGGITATAEVMRGEHDPAEA